MQWGCAHRWKTTTTRPGHDDVVRMRYLSCRRCRLKVKTHERLAVPWDEADLVDQVKAWLPEGQAVALRDKGITELPLRGSMLGWHHSGISFTPAKAMIRRS
jgi:hypothetical protein